jgi:hypothetical protein
MSAMLLDRPNRPHQIEDDRESAFHVLLWLALRYTESGVRDTPVRGAGVAASIAPDMPLRNDVVKLMRAYDEAYVDGRGVVRGGAVKQAFFLSDVLSRLEFSACPELSALVKELVKSLKVRYELPPTPDDIEILEKHEAMMPEYEAMMAKFSDIPDREKWKKILINIRDALPAYRHQIRLDQLEARHWVVDTIRKHLETVDLPQDKATLQVVPKTGSKRKTMLHQANLEERPAKRQSSSSNHVT